MIYMKYKIESINNLKDKDIEFIKENYKNRYQKACGYKFEDDYKRCILAWILLIDLIGDFDENDVYFNEHEKPYIKSKPFFNISHSGEYVAVVVNETEVGIDIQKIEEKNLKLIRQFEPEEQEYIKKEDNVNRFHIMWSIKEAALKCYGRGLSLAFNKVKVIDDSTLKVEETIFKYKKEVVDNYSLVIVYKD